MLTPLQQIFMTALAAGVDISQALPEPKNAEHPTPIDHDRIAAAEAKRKRKAEKRLDAMLKERSKS